MYFPLITPTNDPSIIFVNMDDLDLRNDGLQSGVGWNGMIYRRK